MWKRSKNGSGQEGDSVKFGSIKWFFNEKICDFLVEEVFYVKKEDYALLLIQSGPKNDTRFK
jgi:hypothetical protein